MKRKYVTPEMEIEEFEIEDVIATSENGIKKKIIEDTEEDPFNDNGIDM